MAAVWLEIPAPLRVATICQDDETAEIVSRYRLISPVRELQILVVRNGVLRDGGLCQVIASKDADYDREITFNFCVRLASARDPQTIAAIRFIVTTVLPELRTSDASFIERSLCLLSSWRVSCPHCDGNRGMRNRQNPHASCYFERS